MHQFAKTEPEIHERAHCPNAGDAARREGGKISLGIFKRRATPHRHFPLYNMSFRRPETD